MIETTVDAVVSTLLKLFAVNPFGAGSPVHFPDPVKVCKCSADVVAGVSSALLAQKILYFGGRCEVFYLGEGFDGFLNGICPRQSGPAVFGTGAGDCGGNC